MNNFYVDSTLLYAADKIAEYLYSHLKYIYLSNRPIVFLCIGTDRSTGDSLGPLIGYKLRNIQHDNISIYGSLVNPVHSKNLTDNLQKINSTYKNPYIVAIDACLGSSKNVGKVFINNLPLRPGLALKKNLPEVGDMSITGNVNISGNFDFIILQNTRLYTVMNLADTISSGIYKFILKCNSSCDLAPKESHS